jgi:hypothetical protein
LAEPNAKVIDVTQEILHLIVEAILLREDLVNSGTGLDWKVCAPSNVSDNTDRFKIAYYGLPSAGVLLLALLRQLKSPDCPRVPKAKVLGDLTILAAEIERGTVMQREEPNFALFSQATQTIQRFLDYTCFEEKIEVAVQEQVPFQCNDQWLEQWDHPRDFDIDFWQELGDHSLLFNPGLPSPG